MRKKVVKVALLSLIACGASSAFVSCSDDDWKSPVKDVTTSVGEVNKTISELEDLIKSLDEKIAENKKAAADAAKDAAEALAAAKAAETSAEDAKRYADQAAQKYAEEAAANALAQAAEQLKAEIEAVKALISANADAIAANKDLIDGNSKAIKENAGKIEGNTKAIQELLESLTNYQGETDAKIQEILNMLAQSGGSMEELSNTIAGLNAALEVLEGKCEALGISISDLEAALREEMGTLEQNLAAQIASEAAAREAKDNELKQMIDDLAAQIEALNMSSNLQEFAEFITQTQTQLAALEAWKTTIDDKMADLQNIVDGLSTTIAGYNATIQTLQTQLTEAANKAAANEAAIAAQAALISQNTTNIAKNAADIAQLRSDLQALVDGDIADLKQFKEDVTSAIEDLSSDIDDIKETLRTLPAELNTLIFDNLRGLVFIPEAYVGGIESALANSFAYNPLVKVSGTTDPYTYNAFKVYDYPTWNVVASGDEVSLPAQPTVISYHMNPQSAKVVMDDLSIVSNMAQIINTRADEEYVEIDREAGLTIEDGKITIQVKGTDALYNNWAQDFDVDNVEMPVFALRAEVASNEENTKNFVTSDYAMFVLRKLMPIEIRWNNKAYNAKYNVAPLTPVMPNSGINTTLDGETNAVIEWNAEEGLDLAALLCVDYQDLISGDYYTWNNAEDWGKYGLTLNFTLVEYDNGANLNESSWATITPEGVLTPKGGRDAIGHRPLVYVTLTAENGDLVLNGFLRVLITSENENIETAQIKYPNLKYDCNITLALQPNDVNLMTLITTAAGISQSVFNANYVPAYTTSPQMKQFKKNADGSYSELTGDDVIGIVNYENGKLNWTFTGIDDKQKVYDQPDHTATIYVCFSSTAVPPYPAIYVPMTITEDDKPVLTMGTKVLARWFRENNNTALLNVPVPGSQSVVTTINTDLDQLWKGDMPEFTPTLTPIPSYKYYFAIGNNNYKFTDEAGNKYSLYVEYNTNTDVFGNVVEVSGVDMGETTLRTNVVDCEFNNTKLYAYKVEDGVASKVLIAVLDPATGEVTYIAGNVSDLPSGLGLSQADVDAAEVYLNMFASIASEEDLRDQNRPSAKLVAEIGVVAYDTYCQFAYNLTNPFFYTAFLRPINMTPNSGFTFQDANEEESEYEVFDMVSFTDWRGIAFSDVTSLYAYYNIKSITPDLTRMTTNIVDPDADEFLPVNEANPTLISAFAYVPGTNVYPDYGKITYDNTFTNVKSFKVKIPFVVEYELGELEVWVECSIDTTLGNN